MAKPIVDGLQEEMGSTLDVIYLNLLSDIGRAAAGRYGVHIVPVTLLFDGRGTLLLRQTGMPDETQIRAQLSPDWQDVTSQSKSGDQDIPIAAVDPSPRG